MDSVPEKRCTKCGDLKPFSAFSTRKDKPGIPLASCRECIRQQRAAHYVAHRERIRQDMAAYRSQHREAAAQRTRAWCRENPDRIAAYRQANRKRIAAYDASRYAAHRDQIVARVTAYHAAHPEVHRQLESKRRARKLSAAIGQVDYAEIRRRDRGMCWLCGQAIGSERELHFDHARPLARGGEHSTRNIRLAHKKCNQRKYAKEITHQGYLF